MCSNVINIFFSAAAIILANLFLWKYIHKPRLNFYYSHGFTITHLPKEVKSNVEAYNQFIMSLTVFNSEQTPLKNVQIPHTVDVNYNRQGKTERERGVGLGILSNVPHKFSDDGQIITFDSLAPKEIVTINYSYPVIGDTVNANAIHLRDLSGEIVVRSDEVMGKRANLIAMTYKIPRIVRILIYVFSIVGLWVSVSFLVNLISLVNNMRCAVF